MESEKRSHPRFMPEGLIANITIDLPPPDGEITIEGEVIDMSYTGIKIKLNTPFPADLDYGEIRILLTMPQSGIPVSIHGIIKHCSDQCEYGLQFTDKHNVDNLVFECIKLAK